jgi:uncharacterized membrane protein YesL
MNVEPSSSTILLPIDILKRALRLFWDELFLLGLIGACWMFFGLFVLPFAPLTVGLFYVTNQVAHGNAISFKLAFEAAWRFVSRSLIWGVINVLAGLLVWADLSYYQQLNGDLGIASLTLLVLLVLAWSVVQVFVLGWLVELGPRRLRAAFRQAFVVVVSQPLFVIVLLIILALLAVICWYLPIVLGYAMALLALIANVAILKWQEIDRGKQTVDQQPRATR